MAIERDLRARGGDAVQSADADVVVVNSCSVTATADQGTRQAIRRAARDNPRARIVVTGCYATRCPDEVAALPGVVAVVPNRRRKPWGRSQFVPSWGQSPMLPTRVRPEYMSGTVPFRQRSASPAADGPCGAVEFLLDRTALHAARADWLRRAVQLLHHPDDPRTVGEQADRRDRAAS